MPWVRLDDHYFTHRKTAGLSKDAKLLDLAGMTFSASELRDGMLSDKDVRIVAAQVDIDNPKDCLHELELADRWRHTQHGWEIHDYLDYNPSRAQVLKEREAGAERAARSRRNAVSNAERSPARSGDPVPGSGSGSFNPNPYSGSSPVPPRVPAREIDSSRLCSACSKTLPRRRPAHGLCVDCHGKALVAAKRFNLDATHISLDELVALARA